MASESSAVDFEENVVEIDEDDARLNTFICAEVLIGRLLMLSDDCEGLKISVILAGVVTVGSVIELDT